MILTAAIPLIDKEGEMYAIMDLDFKFEELTKLVSPIPDEILDSPK